jgi:hypothetical protein
LVSDRIFGRDRAHRRLTVRDATGATRDVIWWRGAEQAPPSGQFDLAYFIKASDYQGELDLQIEYVAARRTSAPPAAVTAPEIQIVDYRTASDPLSRLSELRAAGNVAVWAEAYPPGQSPGVQRDQLEPAPALAIWTPPAGPRELRAALEKVSPQRVYLFAVAGDNTDPRRFLPRLAGLLKHTLRRKKGLADLEQLAASSAQRLEAVREGIYLLAARGDVQIVEEEDTIMQLIPGTGHTQPELPEIQARLRALLQETAAYRTYFGRSAPDRLVS